jgi:uncharacterized protein
MSPRTILTLANGLGIDLRFPTKLDYADWDWVAEHLAKEKRYNGATPGVEYSVAQHACLGADAALELYGEILIAAEFLVHDNPEAALKDDTTPKKRAIAEEAEAQFGILAPQVIAAFDAVTARHDAAIHAAAGLPWPMAPHVAAAVKRLDLVMFVTEWRDLMRGAQHPNWAPYAQVQPLPGVIEPWDWRESKRQFLARCHALLPALRGEE